MSVSVVGPRFESTPGGREHADTSRLVQPAEKGPCASPRGSIARRLPRSAADHCQPTCRAASSAALWMTGMRFSFAGLERLLFRIHRTKALHFFVDAPPSGL